MPQTIFTTCYPTSVYLCNSTVPPRAQGKHSSSELWVGADLLINILSWSVFYFDSVCVCVCVCAHLVSHLRCDLYSYNYSWSVSCQVMTFTFMHESDKDAEQHILKHTFVMSCSGIIYHHRGNKGIALLHECGQNGTECVRVTLRTTCTNYLKTQQSTDRTNTASRHLSSILVWKHPGCSGEHKIKSEWKCLTQLSVCSPQGISVILAISCFEGELLYSQAETQMA